MAHVVSDRQRSSRPRRTLVIVDGPGSSTSLRLREIAAGAGFRVVSATSGPMLRSYARRHAPDLIVLTPETGPPGPSEIARSIKEDAATREIPVCQLMRVEGRLLDRAAQRAYPTEAILPYDARDEEILRTMQMLTTRTPRVRYEKRDAAPLEGDLESDTFPEVLQYLFATGKTGRITVREGIRRGMICLEAGRVVHAELGDLSGLSAFRAMCFSQQGWFQFEPDVAAPRRTMRGDGIGLLLEAARLKDIGEPIPPRSVARAKPPRRATRELFTQVAREERSGKSLFGIAVMVGILLLVAYGVYALSAV